MLPYLVLFLDMLYELNLQFVLHKEYRLPIADLKTFQKKMQILQEQRPETTQTYTISTAYDERFMQ